MMTPDDIHRLTVDLGARSYPIIIGDHVIASLGEAINAHCPARQVAIITDENVAALHLDSAKSSLQAAGLTTHVVTVTPGEATKSFASLETVLDALLAAGIERNDLVLALGGGVVGDLAGCAAGLLRRGVRFVQVPTSLLAQVDSSVGGKTGVNSTHGKNLIGVFHQPSLVVADTGALDTLSPREFRAGYAEMVKYGLLGNVAFFEWLEVNWGDVHGGGSARRHAVAESCRAKAHIVAEDEHEHGRRALLNLGHTFGHALEGATGYSQRLIHGEGVAIGMAMAFRYSVRTRRIPQIDADRVTAHLAEVGLPTHINHIPGEKLSCDALMRLIKQDKKVEAGNLTFILVDAIGDAKVERRVDPDDIAAFLNNELEQQ